MKIAGVIIIICSSALMGIQAGEKLKKRNELLKYLLKVMIILKGEICYGGQPLAQSLINVSEKIQSPFNQFMKYTADEMNKNLGKQFPEIWSEAVDTILKDSGLLEKNLCGLKEISESLCYLDMEMQKKTFEMYEMRLREEINESNEKLLSNVKLYKYLGAMGGILVTLIIT